MSGRGPAAAQGRLQMCGTCGDVITFVEVYGDSRVSRVETSRLLLATRAHFASSPVCSDGSTFEGADVAACRCRKPFRMERQQGLFCAKCNGRIAPYLRPAPRAACEERPCRRHSTRT